MIGQVFFSEFFLFFETAIESLENVGVKDRRFE
jgi:hypothetical protein